MPYAVCLSSHTTARFTQGTKGAEKPGTRLEEVGLSRSEAQAKKIFSVFR
ncbi:hypothetical protein ACFLZT_04835 [Thermodesulfobacteriota bacterium]